MQQGLGACTKPHSTSRRLFSLIYGRQDAIEFGHPCVPHPIHVSAVSVVRCEGANYEWSFEGGQVVEANGPDVWVDFQEAGTFDISLTVTNSEGESDTWTWVDLVEVVDEPVVTSDGFTEGFESGQFHQCTGGWKQTDTLGEQAYDLVDTDNGVAQFQLLGGHSRGIRHARYPRI